MNTTWKIERGVRPESEAQKSVIAEAVDLVTRRNNGRRLPLDLPHLYLMLKRHLRQMDVGRMDVYIELSTDKQLLIKKLGSEPINTLAKITEAP